MQQNAKTGWSSIAFGATPVTFARWQSRTARRACAICLRRSLVAPVVQPGSGVSAIM
jgi:hypothetical protein